jgi:hypothetical protein
MDTKSVKRIASKEVKSHEKRMHKMAKGGKTNDMMKQYGRGMAKVVNQRGSARGK